MTTEDDLRTAVDAILSRNQWRLRRDQAVWSLRHEHGWSVPKITTQLAVALVGAGVPLEQHNGLGVSHDSIRRITEGDRPT